MQLPSSLAGYLEQFQRFIEECTKNHFALPYKIVFGSAQFPVWFIAHSVWCCTLVHRSYIRKDRSTLNSLKQLITSAAMVFASRELSAFLLRKGSPVLENPLLPPIFLAVFILITSMPWDLFYKIVTFAGISNWNAMLEGFNQIRYFTLILRLAKSGSFWQKVQLAIMLVVLDQMIEMTLRWIFGGDETPLSSPGNLLFTMLALGGYILATKRVFDIEYLGKANPHTAALTIGLILSFKLAVGLWPDQKQQQVAPNPPETEAAED
jgi:hypothetical protein